MKTLLAVSKGSGLNFLVQGIYRRYSTEAKNLILIIWWAMKGLNLRPHPCKGCALPTELIARKSVVLLEAADELIIVD